MSPFEYSQLDPDESEFRLLQVNPAKLWADPLICTIVQRPLGLKQVVPQYGALSYCWENQRATEEIELDGRPHLISKTIHSFLRRRRQNSPSVFCVWIDAICINQSDDEEKADQIGLMRQIYTDADELLIWLGEGSNSSDLAMDTMENLGRSPNLRPWTMREEEIEAISGLMERPWWFRIWIVQEVVLGAISTLNRPAHIMCGGRKVDYSEFMAGAGRLKRHTKESRQLFHFVDVAVGLDDARTREVEASDNDEQASRRSLLRLLAETRSRPATDPRDKIYGILGLVDPQDTLAQYVKADYTKTAAKLYQELATQALQTLPGLQILRYCGRQELLDLPSWVPDWSTDIHEHHLWNRFDMEDDESSEYDVVEELTERSIIIREIPKDRKHYAAFDHFDQVPIYLSPSGKKLHLLGIVWDTIVTTHAPFVSNVTEPWENATHFMLQVAKCKALVEGSTALPNPYRDNDHRIIAFWRALMADHVGDGSYRPILGYAKWLPPVPADWIARPPHISETKSGLLWRTKIAALLIRKEIPRLLTHEDANYDFPALSGLDLNLFDRSQFDPSDAKSVAEASEILLDVHQVKGIIPDQSNPFAEQKRRLEKVQEVAKLCQNCPYDLFRSPFNLPSVVPDLYSNYRDDIKFQKEEGKVEDELLNSYAADGTKLDIPDRKIILSPAPGCPGWDGDSGAEKYALGRRFFITKRGHFGLAPPEIKEDDKIIFFIGSSVPFVVRGESGKEKEEGGEWRIVGETHVQGLMNGEIIERMREGEASLEVLKIV